MCKWKAYVINATFHCNKIFLAIFKYFQFTLELNMILFQDWSTMHLSLGMHSWSSTKITFEYNIYCLPTNRYVFLDSIILDLRHFCWQFTEPSSKQTKTQSLYLYCQTRKKFSLSIYVKTLQRHLLFVNTSFSRTCTSLNNIPERNKDITLTNTTNFNLHLWKL